MVPIFMICATIGGTIMLFQFVLTLIGFGGDALDFDVDTDFDGDIDADMDADFDGDMDVDADDMHDGHDSTSVFAVLSFRSVVAALAFFGLGGLAANSTGIPAPLVFAVAVACGLAALYGVYWLMRCMYRLQAEGTAKIQNAVGRHATVYLRIPGNESGTGKIQMNLQNRTMEYLAMTDGDEIPTGAKVMVVGVITSDTLAVETIAEPETSSTG